MLAQERLDLVVVATRYVDHHEAMLLAAVRAGAQLYCEKPLAASPAEADRVLAAADAAGVHIAVAHIGRAFGVLPRLKALIAGGKIGRLRRVHGFGKCDQRGGGQEPILRLEVRQRAASHSYSPKTAQSRSNALAGVPRTVAGLGGVDHCGRRFGGFHHDPGREIAARNLAGLDLP